MEFTHLNIYFFIYIYNKNNFLIYYIMTSYIYELSDNVIFENKICLIARKRIVNNAPAYVIKEINTGIVHDNILESNLTQCDFKIIVDEFWNSFTYTGDNGAASQYILNILKNIKKGANIQYGPNSTNTSYSFTISSQTWTKEKS